jgi:hexosaminidase
MKFAQTWGIFNKFNNVLQPTEQTFKFLEEVLTEVMELFPSEYIHIGGDEGSKIWWKQSALSQQIMKENGLKDESALQSYFIHRIEKFVNSKGKTVIGWDEILDGGLAPNAIVMSLAWREGRHCGS